MVNENEAPTSVRANITVEAITITKQNLQDWWLQGLIQDATYIYLALKIDDPTLDEEFNVEEFIKEWSIEKPNGGRKALKEPAVMATIAKIAEKDGVEVVQQLKLGVL